MCEKKPVYQLQEISNSLPGNYRSLGRHWTAIPYQYSLFIGRKTDFFLLPKTIHLYFIRRPRRIILYEPDGTLYLTVLDWARGNRNSNTALNVRFYPLKRLCIDSTSCVWVRLNEYSNANAIGWKRHTLMDSGVLCAWAGGCLKGCAGWWQCVCVHKLMHPQFALCVRTTGCYCCWWCDAWYLPRGAGWVIVWRSGCPQINKQVMSMRAGP